MGAKLLAIAAIAALPAVALSQTSASGAKSAPTSTATAQPAPPRQSTASTGEVDAKSEMTPQMLKAQQDPNLIGSPVWWSTHATADGKPKRE